MADDTVDDTPEDAPAAAAPAADPEEAADTGPEIDPAVEALLARLEAVLGEGVVDHGFAQGNLVVRVRPDAWKRAAEVA